MPTGETVVANESLSKSFPLGTHICMVYDDAHEKNDWVLNYLREGLQRRERVGYFSDQLSSGEVRSWFEDSGGVGALEKLGGRLEISNTKDVYYPKGHFYPEDMLGNLKQFYTGAKQEGFNGSRVTGETSWLSQNIPGKDRFLEYEARINAAADSVLTYPAKKDRFLEYEARINDVIVDYPLTTVCLYDAQVFDGKMIYDVLKVHPLMIVHGQVVHNPCYMKPEEFLKNRY